VNGDRRRRLLARFVDGPAGPTTKALCDVCAEVTGMTGAGVMLMWGDIPAGSICTTDSVSDLIEQLQYSLGEAPASTRTARADRCSSRTSPTPRRPGGWHSGRRSSTLGH
jgi:hypothetical protein